MLITWSVDWPRHANGDSVSRTPPSPGFPKPQQPHTPLPSGQTSTWADPLLTHHVFTVAAPGGEPAVGPAVPKHEGAVRREGKHLPVPDLLPVNHRGRQSGCWDPRGGTGAEPAAEGGMLRARLPLGPGGECRLSVPGLGNGSHPLWSHRGSSHARGSGHVGHLPRVRGPGPQTRRLPVGEVGLRCTCVTPGQLSDSLTGRHGDSAQGHSGPRGGDRKGRPLFSLKQVLSQAAFALLSKTFLEKISFKRSNSM